jgi:hypothetical protein
MSMTKGLSAPCSSGFSGMVAVRYLPQGARVPRDYDAVFAAVLAAIRDASSRSRLRNADRDH